MTMVELVQPKWYERALVSLFRSFLQRLLWALPDVSEVGSQSCCLFGRGGNTLVHLCANKPVAVARKEDLLSVKCQVWEKLDSQLYHKVQAHEMQISPKKRTSKLRFKWPVIFGHRRIIRVADSNPHRLWILWPDTKLNRISTTVGLPDRTLQSHLNPVKEAEMENLMKSMVCQEHKA